jgi:hypothetical protein
MPQSNSTTKGDFMTLPKYSIVRITCAAAIFSSLVGCGFETAPPKGDNIGPSNAAVSNDRKTSPIDESNVAKVKVLGTGTILLDDKQVTIDEIRAAFTKLKGNNGVVWYYRENAAGEPPSQAMAVMQAVVDTKLPIKLSTKPDFSDSVGPGRN